MSKADEQIAAVRREVATRATDAGEVRVVTVAQVYDTTVEDLWDACTTAERLARWFAPVSGDLRLHGHYQVEGNASGTIEQCDPPKRFNATWEYGEEVSWIEVRVSADATGGTRFELEHSFPVDDARWDEFGPGAVGVGWDMGLRGLSLHLSTGTAPAVDPEASMAWMMSDEGQTFMTVSSERWCDASIAAGTDPDAARAAAARTTAFYTAPPPEDPAS